MSTEALHVFPTNEGPRELPADLVPPAGNFFPGAPQIEIPMGVDALSRACIHRLCERPTRFILWLTADVRIDCAPKESGWDFSIEWRRAPEGGSCRHHLTRPLADAAEIIEATTNVLTQAIDACLAHEQGAPHRGQA